MKREDNIFINLDLILIILYLLLVGFGWMNIYSASSIGDAPEILDFSTKYGKQLLWIGLSLPLIGFILLFNANFYDRFSGVLYLVSLFSLVGLFIFGKKINGAVSWYSFGGFSIQPAEFAKVFTALALAKLMSDRNYNLNLIKNQIKTFVIIFTPAFLVALQPDMGSVLIYFTFFFVLNREGLTLIYIVLGVLAILLFLLIIYFGVKSVLIAVFSIITFFVIYRLRVDKQFLRFNGLKILFFYGLVGVYILMSGFVFNNVFKQHHRDRFDILLGKSIDNKNIGYNSYQSELTIGSGGFLGKGFLQGDRTKGNFVPEQHTDYIFSTVGEEWGFVGSSIVIILFILLLLRIVYLSENSANKFTRIYGYGVASILFFHLVVNVGMVIGLLPTVGIPLPFFSYGGSSLWSFTILLFIFIRLNAHKSYDL
ncbi:MAG: rod shape-determining protein RodA [Tenacibaculum sp.]|nr:rod shape-determining protein RodA [Tenacibaculum sp.]